LKIRNVEPIVVHEQDATFPHELDVGGYAGYQVLVRIDTDEGISGWGECCTGGEYGEAAAAVKVLIEKGFAKRLKGENPLEFRKIWERLYQETVWFGRRGLTIFAMSGLDTALVDVAARAKGVSVCELLGGRRKESIPLYASLLFDMGDPEATAKKGLEYVKRGYSAVKYGWGMLSHQSFGMDPVDDERILQTIRETLGKDVRLMVDVGRYVKWDVNYAISMANRLRKYNLFWLEEPLPQDDIEGYVRLTKEVDTPIAAGECLYTAFDFFDIIRRRAVDLVQPDVSKVGGVSEAKRIVAFADENKIPWVPHNWSTAINSAASLHLCASSNQGFLMEFKQEPNPLLSEIIKQPFKISKGTIGVPIDPGLGIEIDLDAIEKYRLKNTGN
jgi:L-alanine-DL-glutamate epimerase-like enolase superfamily enzyme